MCEMNTGFWVWACVGVGGRELGACGLSSVSCVVRLVWRGLCSCVTTHAAPRAHAAGLSIVMDVLGEVGEEEGGTLLEAAITAQVGGWGIVGAQGLLRWRVVVDC